MKTQTISRFGDISVFEMKEQAKPDLKPGYVLVKVSATSVNPVDIKIRTGKIPPFTPDFPAVLHGDVAGVIEQVASDVTNFKVGDEVFGCAGGVKGEGGALAEYMLVDSKLIAKKPASLSMTEAATLPLVCITAWEALFEKVKLSKGQKILIHGGTGGVGHVAIQLAKWAGAEVYATVSSQQKAVIAKSLGADITINYRDESVQEYVNRLTNGNGFEIIFDTIGGDNINNSLEAVAKYGHVISIVGNSTHDITPLYRKSASLHLVMMLLPLLYNMQRERHGKILEKIAQLVEEKKLKPLIDSQKFSFDEVGKAHALLESGKAIGKIAITRV